MKFDVPGQRCILFRGGKRGSGVIFEIQDSEAKIAHELDEVTSTEVMPEVPCKMSIDFFIGMVVHLGCNNRYLDVVLFVHC